MSIHEEECDESDPFASFGDDLCDTLTSERKNPVSTYSRAPRNWGIPTFQEQIDKNITSFTLKRLDDPSKDIVIQLQHRLHSTGSDLWDSALVLAHALPRRSFLEAIGASVDNADDWFKNLNVLELGSGTGALGLYCSKCMGVKHVTMTDLSANLPLIENNTEKNSPTENITICPLDWTQELDKGLTGYDLIIGTDLCELIFRRDIESF
jgi:methylase of polypeptide subunit release factors